MSEVEETIERIKVQTGVEGYVISNRHGQVLRRFPTMPQEVAELYAQHMIALSAQARGVIRDINPKHELRFLRIRTKNKEVMVAYDAQFIVIVIQRWLSADKGI
jgi:dynein light chain roadblock-type